MSLLHEPGVLHVHRGNSLVTRGRGIPGALWRGTEEPLQMASLPLIDVLCMSRMEAEVKVKSDAVCLPPRHLVSRLAGVLLPHEPLVDSDVDVDIPPV